MSSSKLPEDKINNFYRSSSVQKFLLTAVNKNHLIKNKKLDDPLYINAEVTISLQQTTSYRKLEYFVTRYPVLIPAGFSLDDVQSEFINYQSQELPPTVTNAPQADQQWKVLDEIVVSVTVTGGKQKFKVLSQVMLAILAIPRQCKWRESLQHGVEKSHRF